MPSIDKMIEILESIKGDDEMMEKLGLAEEYGKEGEEDMDMDMMDMEYPEEEMSAPKKKKGKKSEDEESEEDYDMDFGDDADMYL